MLEVIEESYSSNSKSNNNFDEDGNNQLALINKIIDHNTHGIKVFYKVCLKSKYMRILKSKKMTPII